MIPALAEKLKKTKEAVTVFQRYLKDIQNSCQHPHVLQSNYLSNDFFSALKGHRICLECGLEEECRNLSDEDYGYTKLKTKGFHKLVYCEEIWKNRIPFDDKVFL